MTRLGSATVSFTFHLLNCGRLSRPSPYGESQGTSTMAEPNIFWDQLIQLIEEGKVVPIVGQDLLTVPESTGHKLLYPFLAQRLANYLKVAADGLPEGSELNEVACR